MYIFELINYFGCGEYDLRLIVDEKHTMNKGRKKGNIHDHNFKHNFTSKRVAHDFLKHNLPQKVLDSVHIASVQIESTEFLPTKYRSKRKADILYSVKDRKGKKLYALIHLEGQSSYDKYMALRVWEYHVAITRAHLKKGKKKIPLILTYVLYHGNKKWTSAKSIAELFDDVDLYVDVSLKAPFLLHLTKAQIKELKKQEAAAAPQLIMKGQGLGDYCEMLGELWPLLRKYDQVDEENIDYMTTTDKHDDSQFLEKLSKFDPTTANNYKTMFEAAIQREHKRALKLGIMQGKEEGLRQGKQEGRQAGRQEGRQETIASLLKQGVISQEQAKQAVKGIL